MKIMIEGWDKPKNCMNCPFNKDDCWCKINHEEIDRDDYTTKNCPIKIIEN